MYVQRDFAANLRELRKGWHGDSDVVTHAGTLNDGLVGMLGKQLATKMSDHAEILPGSF